MKWIIFLAWLSLAVSGSIHQRPVAEPDPFYSQFRFDTTSQPKAFDYVYHGFAHSVYAINGNDQVPDAYASYVHTPVCSDSLCYWVHLEVYWNVAGSYLGFDTVGHAPLTKFDHLPFSRTDYQKLDKILSDKDSDLQWMEVEDLFDENKSIKSEVVDAFSGATAKEVQNLIVPGAVYSTHTLWHLVHGEVKEKIRKHAQTQLTDKMLVDLLQSESVELVHFGLENMEYEDFFNHKRQVLSTFRVTQPLNRRYILNHLPASLWVDDAFVRSLIGSFSAVDTGSRSLMLMKLMNLPSITEALLVSLSRQVTAMDDKQLDRFFTLIQQQGQVPNTCMYVLDSLNKADNYRYHYLLDAYLQKMRVD